MDNSIVSNSASPLKDIGYQSAQESLCVKIEHARHLAKIGMDRIIAKGKEQDEQEDKTDSSFDAQLYHLLWCQADLLNAAFTECEELTVHDFVNESNDN